MSDPYTIRQARPSDLPLLPLIEAAAATRFRATPYAFLIEDSAANPVSATVDLRSALRSCACLRHRRICAKSMCIRSTRATAWGGG
jgi:hypothetical protein